MQHGLSLPNWGAYADPLLLVSLARDAEAAGWDGFFVWDHILYLKDERPPMADPWVALAAIAAATQRMRIGPLVTAVPRRRPWKLARETVTLDHLSGGRVVLGVGLGWPADAEFAWFGEEPDDRVRAEKLDEGLTVLAGLWTGEPFAFEGKHFTVRETVFLPPPVQRPRIPVWVAGMWPNRPPFRRAARWDGVVPLSLITPFGELMPPEELRAIVDYTMQHRTTNAPFEVVLGGGTPRDNLGRAAEIVASYQDAGLTWWVESVNPWGDEPEVARRRIRQGPVAI
jgi:alkanesulfonate monooxygenase SsuD/methylene tetrahydromethanopterin reductase-like flavin-dependent oxidoreductase (luciferase family)